MAWVETFIFSVREQPQKWCLHYLYHYLSDLHYISFKVCWLSGKGTTITLNFENCKRGIIYNDCWTRFTGSTLGFGFTAEFRYSRFSKVTVIANYALAPEFSVEREHLDFLRQNKRYLAVKAPKLRDSLPTELVGKVESSWSVHD